MQTAHTLSELREARQRLGDRALVPTMDNLHAGHLSLVALARQSAQPVVTSIFVNRLQFAPSEDFERYRTRRCPARRHAPDRQSGNLTGALTCP